MSFNSEEYAALEDPFLDAKAKTLYMMCFRRFMSFRDGMVYLSESTLVAALEHRPDPRSKEKPTSVSRQKVRTLVGHLEKTGLITKVKNGDINAGISPSWRCNLATHDAKKAFIYAISQQPDSNHAQQPVRQPAQQPSQTQQKQGTQAQQQPAQQPAQQPCKNGQHQPISDITAKEYIYIGDGEQKSDKPKKPKPEANPNSYKKIDLSKLDPQIAKEMAQHFIDHRIARKSPLTQFAFDSAMSNAIKCQKIGLTANEAIQETIDASWNGINVKWLTNRLGATNNAKYKQPTKTPTNTLFNDPDENFRQLVGKLQS